MGQSAEELKRDIERTREGLGETLDAIGDRVSPGRMIERRKNRVTSGVRDLRDRVMGTATRTGHALAERAHDVGDGVSSAAGSVQELSDAMRHRTQGAPVMAGAIAFGVGFLVAAAFPASRTEREAGAKVLDKVEPLKSELTATGKELAEHLKEPALEAANEVKDAARDSAQAVTETAKAAATETVDQAKSTAESVKSDVKQEVKQASS